MIDETSELEEYNPLLVEQVGLVPQNAGIPRVWDWETNGSMTRKVPYL